MSAGSHQYSMSQLMLLTVQLTRWTLGSESRVLPESLKARRGSRTSWRDG